MKELMACYMPGRRRQEMPVIQGTMFCRQARWRQPTCANHSRITPAMTCERKTLDMPLLTCTIKISRIGRRIPRIHGWPMLDTKQETWVLVRKSTQDLECRPATTATRTCTQGKCHEEIHIRKIPIGVLATMDTRQARVLDTSQATGDTPQAKGHLLSHMNGGVATRICTLPTIALTRTFTTSTLSR
jgi:hypothetical protein